METTLKYISLSPFDKFELLTEENKKAVILQIETLIKNQSESRSSYDFPA